MGCPLSWWAPNTKFKSRKCSVIPGDTTGSLGTYHRATWMALFHQETEMLLYLYWDHHFYTVFPIAATPSPINTSLDQKRLTR